MRIDFVHLLYVMSFALLPSMGVVAQSDSLYLDLDRLFELGLQQNLQLAADKLQEDAVAYRASSARSRRLPEIEVGVNAGYVGQPIIFEDGLSEPTRPASPDWSQNYAVNLEQPLYHGGRIRYAIRQADIEREIAALRTATDRADIKMSLLDYYLDLFCLYKQRIVLQRNISESERRLSDIRRMKEEGIITNNDVLRSEMQLTNDRLALEQTENGIRLTSRRLDILLGLDESLLLYPDTALLGRKFVLGSCDSYISEAYMNDPSMLLLTRRTDLARNEVDAAKAELMPVLSLYAANTLARPVSRTLADMYNNAWNVGLSLSYPLSSIYHSRHRVREARKQVDVSLNAEQQHRQQIRMAIHTAYMRHKEALDRVEALKLSVTQAEENYRITRNRYLNQLAILTDLLDADNLRLNAELQLTQARTQVIYTYYELQRAIGKL